MQNRTLSLSLLMSAALVIPSLAMAAPTSADNNIPADMSADMDTDINADMNNVSTDDALQEEIVDPNSELMTTQPSSVDNVDSVDNNEVDTNTEDEAKTRELYNQYNDPNYQSSTVDVDSNIPADMNDQSSEEMLPVQ